MEVRPVVPRDTRWEIETPVYRVYFWEAPTKPMGMYISDEHEIRDAADVHKVIVWADSVAGTRRTYTLYALVESAHDGPGLVQLRGSIPRKRPIKLEQCPFTPRAPSPSSASCRS